MTFVAPDVNDNFSEDDSIHGPMSMIITYSEFHLVHVLSCESRASNKDKTKKKNKCVRWLFGPGNQKT